MGLDTPEASRLLRLIHSTPAPNLYSTNLGPGPEFLKGFAPLLTPFRLRSFAPAASRC